MGKLDDDTLKCAICFDLCVRPITVGALASGTHPGRMLTIDISFGLAVH